ncbi:MAG: hypothetical protein JJU00_04280 [Opitutales bacterium]|nr:hypothetical protein [Opitutales bacterium]
MKSTQAHKPRFFPVILAAAFLFSAHALSGGVVYSLVETTPGEEPGEAEPSVTMWVADGSLKVRGSGDDAGEMIFHTDRREMVIIDHDDRAYTRLDEAAVKRIGARMEAAMAEYEEAMASVPAAQRQMVESMMRDRMGDMLEGEKAPEVEYKDTGSTETVGDYSTRVFEAAVDGRKVRELFVADWSDVAGGREFSEAFEGMASFFSDMIQALSRGPMATMLMEWSADSWLDGFADVGGFPVKIREYGPGGSAESETHLVGTETFEADETTFAPPSGYRQRSLDL